MADTHIDIVFAVNHVSPPHFCRLSNSSFWMQDDFVKVWNVAGVNIDKKKGENARFLTNNALERFNRHFNHIVPSSHPNLVVFAHALKDEANSVSQHLEDVRKGREEAPPLIPLHSLRFQRSFICLSGTSGCKKMQGKKSDGVEAVDLDMFNIFVVVGILVGFL